MKLVQAQIDNYPIIKEKISDEQKRFMELRYKAILGKKNDLELNTAVEKMNGLDRFIISIYVNDNEILSSSFDAIKHIPRRHTPSSQKIKESITDHTEDKGQSINKTTSPAKAGSAVGDYPHFWIVILNRNIQRVWQR